MIHPKRSLSLRFVAGLGLPLVVLVAGACSNDDNNVVGPRTIVGSGVLAQEVRTVGAVSAISFLSQGDVTIDRGLQAALTVEAEDNLLPYLETDMQGFTLQVHTTSNVSLMPTRPIEFDLTVTGMDSIVHAGVGTIEATDLDPNRMEVDFSGVGEISLVNLTAVDLVADLSGVGQLVTEGTVTRQEVTISGVGDYEGGSLNSVDAVLTLTGIGSATVRFTGDLDITFSGASGTVSFYGDPAHVQVTGTGTVVDLDP